MRVRAILPILTIAGVCCLSTVVFAQTITHVVSANETVYSIAREYNVDPNVLLRVNHISDPRLLRVGTVLRIPDSSTVSYKVRSGDTLYRIAHTYGIDLDKLLAYNHLSEHHTLRVGEVILIPAASSNGSAGADSKKVDLAKVAGPSSGNSGGSGSRSEDTFQDATSGGNSQLSTDEGKTEVKVPPLPISIQTAPVDSSGKGAWPLPGKRYVLSGKFPGIMIRGKQGDPVVAVAAGRVIYTGPYTTFGRVVFVQSADGYVYIYGGNDHISVSPGDKVEAGSTIGTLGTTPFEQSAQLYFSVWKDNRFINPNDAPRG